MIVLGIDASTTATGFAVLDDGELIHCGLIKPKSDDWRYRVKEITRVLEEIIEEYHPSTIMLEDVPLESKNVQTLYKLSVLQGYISKMCDEESVDLCLQTPTKWRQKLGMFDGTKEGKKREVLKLKAVQMANNMFELELKKTHDDIAEAILVGYSYFVKPKNKKR